MGQIGNRVRLPGPQYIPPVGKAEALEAQEFHRNSDCIVGQTQRWRRNGQTKVWVRTPRWEVPVKYGLYRYGRVSSEEAHQWHPAGRCPLNNYR